MKTYLGVCVLVASMFVLADAARAQTTVFTGTCDITQISYTTTDSVSNTVVSTTFTDVPNTVLYFDVNIGECAKIDLSMTIASDSHGPLFLRLLFDENPNLAIVPSQIELNPTSKASYFSASFILPLENRLGPGNHNVRIQWRSPQPSRVLSGKTSVVTYHN